jgi:hypothetical protein
VVKGCGISTVIAAHMHLCDMTHTHTYTHSLLQKLSLHIFVVSFVRNIIYKIHYILYPDDIQNIEENCTHDKSVSPLHYNR